LSASKAARERLEGGPGIGDGFGGAAGRAGGVQQGDEKLDGGIEIDGQGNVVRHEQTFQHSGTEGSQRITEF